MLRKNKFYKSLPGISSIFCSLYFEPNEYADDDWWIVFSAFSTSYEPGAVKGNEKNSKNFQIAIQHLSNSALIFLLLILY